MTLTNKDIQTIRRSTFEFLVKMLYARALWDDKNPTGVVDAYAACVRETMLSNETRGEVSVEIAIAMTEAVDAFFVDVKTLILQRAEREKKRG